MVPQKVDPVSPSDNTVFSMEPESRQWPTPSSSVLPSQNASTASQSEPAKVNFSSRFLIIHVQETTKDLQRHDIAI